MESSNIFSCVLFFLAAIISAIFLKQRKSFCRSKRTLLPPGEMGLPLVGETMDFYRAQKNNRLFEEFVQPRLSKYGKIFKTNLMGSPTVIVNGAEANRFILSSEFKLVVSSWPSSSVQLMGTNSIMGKQLGEQHRCIRSLISSSLNYAPLEALVPKICNTVELHLQKNWQGKDNLSLYRSTKVLTFTIVFECFLGLKVDPQMVNTFERVLEGVFKPAINFPGTTFSRAKKARQEIEKEMVKVVREKRKEMESGVEPMEKGGLTLLSRLVDAMIQGEITEEEVVDNVIVLVFAAHDTTSFAIAMTFKMLAQHPEWYSRVLQEHMDILSNKGPDESLTMEDTKKMKYTWQVARESMRLFPPIFGSFRKAITDIEYEGFTIPKGWKVLWTTYGTHYNTDYFEDPLRFDPSRFEEGSIPPYVFLPFGGGTRACAGYQLAKLNILIFVHFVLTSYNWSLVYPNESITMDPLPFPAFGMPVNISPKMPSTP
ncbi:hypothetical protein SLA2020_050120 [Shorea laevis]